MVEERTTSGPHERWHLEQTAAEIYQAELVPAIFGPWAPIAVDAAALQPGEAVLDVACGTGVVAREAAARVGPGGRVIGLDLNPGMLAVAGALPAPPGASIEWREGSATAMPFDTGAFDVVICQQGLQYVPDQPGALREMHRVLVPGGRLVLLVWQSIEQSPGYALLAGALERHLGPTVAAIMRAPFVFTEPAALRTLVGAAGFRDVAVRRASGTLRFSSTERLFGIQIAASPLAGPYRDADEDTRAALLDDCRTALRPYEDAQGVAFPMGAFLTVAHT